MENKQMIKQTKFGWVDLSNLVYNKTSVDWSASIGRTVNFQYDNILSTLTIVGRSDDIQYVYIDIPGYVEHYKIYTGQIRHCQLGSALKNITSDFRHNIGDCVNNMLILDTRKDKKGHKIYDFKCTKDGYVGHIREDHIETGHGCPVCAGKAVLVGYNDIATTRPDIADLFLNSNDGLKYSEHSNKYAYFKCPRCGNIIYACINYVSIYGLSCKKCGDGISYPNKFVYNFIEQLSSFYNKNLNFQPEKTFDWSTNYQHKNKKLSGNKIYDMYIDNYNIIIENHGEYHYQESFFSIKRGLTLQDIQENDKIKMKLAIDNGIHTDHYIVLDCSKSEMNYIKDSIMSSNLPKLLNFTEDQIDWDECNKFATSSRVYEACNYWNDGIKSYKDISSIMKMHNSTIRRYIKRGKELGICL